MPMARRKAVSSRVTSMSAAAAGITMKAKTGRAPMQPMATEVETARVKNSSWFKASVRNPEALAVSGSKGEDELLIKKPMQAEHYHTGHSKDKELG